MEDVENWTCGGFQLGNFGSCGQNMTLEVREGAERYEGQAREMIQIGEAFLNLGRRGQVAWPISVAGFAESGGLCSLEI